MTGVFNPPRIVVFICKGKNGGSRHYWSEDQINGEKRDEAECPECSAPAYGRVYVEGETREYAAYMLQLSKTPMVHISAS